MSFLDHLFVIAFAVIYPIAGFIGFRRLLRRAARGEVIDRSQLYRNTYIGHWTLFFLFLGLWIGTSRDFSAVGVNFELDLWTAISALLTAAAIVTLVVQLRHVQDSTQEQIDNLSRRIGKLAIIVPHNESELMRFYGIAVTAGIVEEVLWRGFMIWYLSLFMPLWAAALVSALGFAVAHAYQGLSNLPQIAGVSATLTAVYLLSGSIWLPIVLHAAIDILQGRLGYDVINRSGYREQFS
ncbi:MAG: CPBP family intramembrane glutamic endopeptidase [Woeseiaceae bacterium]|nr:CPBP family intramembrane glutamic endopeptidase [Woeseiaceae bacterium]